MYVPKIMQACMRGIREVYLQETVVLVVISSRSSAIA